MQVDDGDAGMGDTGETSNVAPVNAPALDPSTQPARGARVYLVNVGVNVSHDLFSPIFADGTFEFVPIPLPYRAKDCTPTPEATPVTYSQLRAVNREARARKGEPPPALLSFFSLKIQAKYWDTIAHNDPLLAPWDETTPGRCSYGDHPHSNTRAMNLREAQAGDILLFLANLKKDTVWRPGVPQNRMPERGLYLIGALEIGAVWFFVPGARCLRNAQGEETSFASKSYNAHVNQLLTLPKVFANQRFSVFDGSPYSLRFRKAVPISAELVQRCLRDANNAPLDVARFRSLDACVGAHTRTVRAQFRLDGAEDRARFRELLGLIGARNELGGLPWAQVG